MARHRAVAMPDGTERKFVQDGDTVVMRACYFGEVRADILASITEQLARHTPQRQFRAPNFEINAAGY